MFRTRESELPKRRELLFCLNILIKGGTDSFRRTSLTPTFDTAGPVKSPDQSCELYLCQGTSWLGDPLFLIKLGCGACQAKAIAKKKKKVWLHSLHLIFCCIFNSSTESKDYQFDNHHPNPQILCNSSTRHFAGFPIGLDSALTSSPSLNPQRKTCRPKGKRPLSPSPW